MEALLIIVLAYLAFRKEPEPEAEEPVKYTLAPSMRAKALAVTGVAPKTTDVELMAREDVSLARARENLNAIAKHVKIVKAEEVANKVRIGGVITPFCEGSHAAIYPGDIVMEVFDRERDGKLSHLHLTDVYRTGQITIVDADQDSQDTGKRKQVMNTFEAADGTAIYQTQVVSMNEGYRPESYALKLLVFDFVSYEGGQGHRYKGGFNPLFELRRALSDLVGRDYRYAVGRAGRVDPPPWAEVNRALTRGVKSEWYDIPLLFAKAFMGAASGFSSGGSIGMVKGFFGEAMHGMNAIQKGTASLGTSDKELVTEMVDMFTPAEARSVWEEADATVGILRGGLEEAGNRAGDLAARSRIPALTNVYEKMSLGTAITLDVDLSRGETNTEGYRVGTITFYV